MGAYIPSELRAELNAADNRGCAYCRTTEMNTGQPMTVDHIIPESQGGLTTCENLSRCCRRCNEFKGSKTSGQDPLTGDASRLFNPRVQEWRRHFAWDETGTLIVGLTAVGRTTIVELKMNDEIIIFSRRRWVSVDWHPPK